MNSTYAEPGCAQTDRPSPMNEIYNALDTLPEVTRRLGFLRDRLCGQDSPKNSNEKVDVAQNRCFANLLNSAPDAIRGEINRMNELLSQLEELLQ